MRSASRRKDAMEKNTIQILIDRKPHLFRCLSKSEIRVLEKLLLGISNAEIAQFLCVGDKTVKFHLTNIYRKLNVKSRGDCIRFVLTTFNGIPESEQVRVLTPFEKQLFYLLKCKIPLTHISVKLDIGEIELARQITELMKKFGIVKQEDFNTLFTGESQSSVTSLPTGKYQLTGDRK